MAKRYHGSFINETSGNCHLPTEVVEKTISKTGGVGRDVAQDLYIGVDAQMSKDKSSLSNITNPKKF